MPYVRRKTRNSHRPSRSIRKYLTLLALLATPLVLLILAYNTDILPTHETANDWYEVSQKDQVLVKLPADDAPHKSLTEWWYYNGSLTGENGQEYSFHYTVFLQNALTTHTVIHASFVDHTTDQHFSYQARMGGNPSLGTEASFDFTMGEWVMRGQGGYDALKGKTADFQFDLSLTPLTEPVFQGGTGLLDFKEAGKSYYYSRARQKITGQAGLTGAEQPVTGAAWFDHQWGDFRTTLYGWEWFALQLDDGADIMLYQSYSNNNDSLLMSGTYTKNNKTKLLVQGDVISRSSTTWQSPLSQISYPLDWTIEIPSEQLKLNITPRRRANEFDGRKTTYNLYWEGAVIVTGTHSGKGFLEINTANQR